MSKILYRTIFYSTEVSDNCRPDVKIGDKVVSGQKIGCSTFNSEIKEYPINGKVIVAIGDTVTIGQELYIKGRFKKSKFVSDVEGTIKDITKDTIKIEVIAKKSNEMEPSPSNNLEQNQIEHIIPIAGVVKSLNKKYLVLESEGIDFSLVYSRGQSVTAEIVFVEDIEKFCAEPDPKKVAEKIVLTSKFNAEYYSTFSAFGAKAVVALQTDYLQLQEITMSSMAFGLVFGYGDLNIDVTVLNYISKLESKIGWLDPSYNRFVIFEDKKPEFIDKYAFDVDNMLAQQ